MRDAFPFVLADSVNWWHGWKWTGSFTALDLIAASTNALNGALLARRPDHYKNFSVVGVILMFIGGVFGILVGIIAILMGLVLLYRGYRSRTTVA